MVFTDFVKANINEFTVREVDLSPLKGKLDYLSDGLREILKDKYKRRKFMVTDDRHHF